MLEKIEAMQTTIGKKFRTRKVKAAYEKRLIKQKEEEGMARRREDADGFNNGGRVNEVQSLIANKADGGAYNDEIMQNNGNKNTSGTGAMEKTGSNNKKHYEQANYDTVTSVHDIDQDGHVYSFPDHKNQHHLQHHTGLPKIAEIPSNRNNNNNISSSVSDVSEKV